MLEAVITSSCSPNVHPMIVNAIVKTESSFNPFAIGVNRGAGRLARQPKNYAEAVAVAKRLLANGANFDMGLGQINSANMRWLGLSVEEAFHPCTNLKALQTVYLSCYKQAGDSGNGTRMQRAFSCYNTGNTRKGFSNGYVRKVTTNFNNLVARHYPQRSVIPTASANNHGQIQQQVPVIQTVSQKQNDKQIETKNEVIENAVIETPVNASLENTQGSSAKPAGNIFSFQKNSIFNQ